MIRVGMAEGTLRETFEAQWPGADSLRAVAMFVEDDRSLSSSSAGMVLVLTDLCYLSVGIGNVIRQQMSAACGLPAERIVIHCTHNHTAPQEPHICADALAERLSAIVAEARRCAAPAKMAYAEVDTDRQFNINRRKTIAGIGAFTLWMGWEAHGPAKSPDGGKLIRARLSNWRGDASFNSGTELPGPILYDGATDGLIQGIFFRTESNEPVGSLLRYSAHPAMAGHTTQRRFNADFPGVVRKRMAQGFGGVSGFLTGPCGNLCAWEQGDWPEPSIPTDVVPCGVPWMPHTQPDSGLAEARRIGNGLVDALLPHLPSAGEFRACRQMRFAMPSVSLPVRDDLLADFDESDRRARACREQFTRLRKTAPLPELKRLADLSVFMDLHRAFYDKFFYLTRAQQRTGQIAAWLPMLAIDDVVFLGFPGETFWETARPAFDAALKRGLNLISFTEANGEISYIPTDAERAGGDYECCCSILAPGAEQKLRSSAVAMVEGV